MDTQHIQGEGVPPQAGEGQRHYRPDARYLSLNPATVSFSLPQRTTEQEGGKTYQLCEKGPSESVWPVHIRVFHIKGDDSEKEGHTGGFLWKDAHMCLLNQRLLLADAGEGDGGRGGCICLVPVFRGDLPPPLHFNVYHFHSLDYHEWVVKAEVTRKNADVRI